jgi:N-acetylmuramic acid 6-phosphate etherase
MLKTTSRENAEAYLLHAKDFMLGDLPTELRHERTAPLSELANESLLEATRLLKSVEIDALTRALPPELPAIEAMAREISQTFFGGGRVFLCGCGATGRLSLTLEALWRQSGAMEFGEVISFMAGGDYALIRSIESFEDHPEFGARQLHDLGFGENDLLIATTEGGETPFVIGATEEAARISKRRPYFLFCNPKPVLQLKVERSRRVLENPAIQSISLVTGPMALAGSTRLQASTVLNLGVGAALFAVAHGRSVGSFVAEFESALRTTDFECLVPLIEREAEVYRARELCVHESDHFDITVLTDTTERSPTFSLSPFENLKHSPTPLSWTYLAVTANDTSEAWRKILARPPRALAWPEYAERYGQDALLGFDFDQAKKRRGRFSKLHAWSATRDRSDLVLRLDELEARLNLPKSVMCQHLILKIALNISSTLVMGRLGRFRSNMMLFVRSSNNKLIDRSIRYVQALLTEAGIAEIGYDEICFELFDVLEGLHYGEPAVPLVFDRLRQKHRGI